MEAKDASERVEYEIVFCEILNDDGSVKVEERVITNEIRVRSRDRVHDKIMLDQAEAIKQALIEGRTLDQIVIKYYFPFLQTGQ
jgi:hypothetical protein